jgi:hypothetical protein
MSNPARKPKTTHLTTHLDSNALFFKVCRMQVGDRLISHLPGISMKLVRNGFYNADYKLTVGHYFVMFEKVA